jgi:lipopolysaccharide biosynthesis glycosyltransferase
LSATVRQYRKRLDYKWNAIRPFFREPNPLPLSQEEIERVRREVQIIHYNGWLKPWSYFSDHPRKSEYEKYLRMTEWRDSFPTDRTTMNMIRKFVSRFTPQRAKKILKAITSKP